MSKPELILVVDDSPHIVKLIQVNLEFEGYRTLGAFDGKEALEKVKRHKPNLIILDILMPNLDGWEVLEALKADPETAPILVIVLTAVGRNEDRRRGFELGVADYVTKPFNASRLLEAVEHTLHPSPPATPTHPVPSSGTLIRHGVPVRGAPPDREDPRTGKGTPEVLGITHAAIVGGSELAFGILQTLLGNSRVKILGLATQDTRGPAAKLARELRIFITADPYALCKLQGLDLIIETEPHTLALDAVERANPNLEVLRGYSTNFVWSLVEEKEVSEERARGLVKELHLKIKEINALYEAGKVIGSVMELDTILFYVLDLMGDFVNAPSGALYLKQGETFNAKVTRGAGRFPSPLPKSVQKKAFGTGKPVLLTKETSGLPFPQSILVPLGSGDKSLAFVALLFDKLTEISENDLAFLDTMASQAAIALEKATLYDDLRRSKTQIEALLGRVIYAQEEERKRVAAEIHDSIAQSMVSVLTRVQMCQSMVPKSSREAHHALEELKKLTFENIKEVRRIVFNLRPSTLDDLGLIPTLEHFLKKFEAEEHIRASMQVKMPHIKLPPMIETAIYRIVQEALTNVRKHSKATRVLLDLQTADGKLSLVISDNGTGFNPEKARTRGLGGDAVGILGMKERVALLGGTFKVDAFKGKGSKISIEVPIDSS